MIFLLSQQKHIPCPSLELSCQDSSNEWSQYMLLWGNGQLSLPHLISSSAISTVKYLHYPAYPLL